MSDASVRPRVANLLGALAVALQERILVAATSATARPASDTTALVGLTSFLEGESQDAVASVLGLTQSGAVRLVDRLADAGLVRRQAGPDARTHAVVPTEAGRRAGLAAREGRLAAIDEVLEVLDAADVDRLLPLLEKLLGGLTTSREDARHTCRLCTLEICGHEDGRCPVTRAADISERAVAVASDRAPDGSPAHR